MIPFNKPYFTGKETEYIKEAVASGHISGNGKYTKKCQQFFEEKYGFKKGMILEPVLDGLTDDEMDYHERRVYDEQGGEAKLKNRQIPMTDEKINILKEKYCP